MKMRIVLCFSIFLVFGCAREEAKQPGAGVPTSRVELPAEEEAGQVLEAQKAIRITTADYYDCSPCWSPDGKKIAYCSYREGEQNIWVIGLSIGEDGKLSPSGEPQQVTTGDFVDQDLSWSPDGGSIVFSSNRKGEYGLFTVKLEDKSITDLGQKGIQPRWSPQGDRIAFVSMNNIWVKKVERKTPGRFLTVSRYNDYPCWSPDAKKLIFFSGGDLMVVGEGGGPRTPLTSSGWNSECDWSVERDEVVFVSNRGSNYDLWKAKPDDWDPVQLTDGPSREHSPRWSPDGKWVAFRSDYEGSFDIWVISVKKEEPKAEE